MKALLSLLLLSFALAGQAQSIAPPRSLERSVSQLENLKDATKGIAERPRAGKVAATSKTATEARPEINRQLVASADDFLRTLRTQPTRQAYLQCLDRGLVNLAPLAATMAERQEIALYYQDLMDIVGLDSSDGKLLAFVNIAEQVLRAEDK